MKKFLFLLIFAITCISCNVRDYSNVNEENATFGWNYLDNKVKYRKVVIDEHQYIVFMTNYVGYGSPIISVIHSESCSCKNKKKYN